MFTSLFKIAYIRDAVFHFSPECALLLGIIETDDDYFSKTS